MTTVVASREWIAADSMIGSEPPVSTEKIVRKDGRLFSGAGQWTDVLQVIDYLCGGDEPDLQERDAVDVVMVADDGIWVCNGALVKFRVTDERIAIGSGSAYATGAMDAGADVLRALEIAAQRDPATRGPFRLVRLHAQATGS